MHGFRRLFWLTKPFSCLLKLYIYTCIEFCFYFGFCIAHEPLQIYLLKRQVKSFQLLANNVVINRPMEKRDDF